MEYKKKENTEDLLPELNEEEIELIKGHEVTKIISDKRKITGVQLNDQTIINCNNVICNADPPAVYEKMLNGNTNNSFLFKWKKKWLTSCNF